MSLDSDRLKLKNDSDAHTAADIRNKPASGAASTHALYVKQYGSSGQGAGIKVESENEDEPVIVAQGPGPLLDLRDEDGTSKLLVANDGSASSGALTVTGDLVIQSTPEATDSDDLPHGLGNSRQPTGLVISSSYPSDDVADGIDGTGRINLYSYQRASYSSFGENIRHFLMRSDAKSMQAYYMPVISATDKSGYVAATRDPAAEGVQWRPVSWTGSHFEANNHASIHGHWELEIPDSNGELQGRLEVPFIDQVADTNSSIDDVTIGVDYTNIRTNLADFSIRAQNITTGPFAGQTTCLRVGGGNDRNKEIHLSISSDMGTSGRRWVLRATSETESGSNAGTNFQIARYDDTGTLLDTPMVISRSTGNVTLTPGFVVRRSTSTVSSLSLNTTSLGGGVGVLAIGNANTVPASNPTGGVVLYVSNGRLKVRQPDGTDQFVALTAT